MLNWVFLPRFRSLQLKMSSDAKEESGSHIEDGEKPPLSSSKVVHAGPTKRRTSSGSPEASPPHGKKFPFKIPSPVPTRRTRTSSQWVHSNNCCQLVDISENGRQPRRFLSNRKTIHWSGVINLIQFQIVLTPFEGRLNINSDVGCLFSLVEKICLRYLFVWARCVLSY